MEKQDPTVAIDNQEVISPSNQSFPADAHEEIRTTTRNSTESEEERPSLAQRVVDAFREGVASAKPDYDNRPEVRTPPPAKEKRPESSEAGILDRVVQEGRSAAAGVGDMTASALDSVVQLVKKAPGLTHKYAEAFREGAASVKAGESGERREARSPSARKDGFAAEGRAILDRVWQSVGSAGEMVRGAVVNLKPGEGSGAKGKIRNCKERIQNLYVEIGRETANSWANEGVAAEKLAVLLEELRKNEEEIQNLEEHMAEVAAAKRMQATGSQPAAKEAVVTPTSPPAPEPGVDAEPVSPEEATDRDLLKKETL